MICFKLLILFKTVLLREKQACLKNNFSRPPSSVESLAEDTYMGSSVVGAYAV